jgi:hypothetical protein
VPAVAAHLREKSFHKKKSHRSQKVHFKKMGASTFFSALQQTMRFKSKTHNSIAMFFLKP